MLKRCPSCGQFDHPHIPKYIAPEMFVDRQCVCGRPSVVTRLPRTSPKRQVLRECTDLDCPNAQFLDPSTLQERVYILPRKRVPHLPTIDANCVLLAQHSQPGIVIDVAADRVHLCFTNYNVSAKNLLRDCVPATRWLKPDGKWVMPVNSLPQIIDYLHLINYPICDWLQAQSDAVLQQCGCDAAAIHVRITNNSIECKSHYDPDVRAAFVQLDSSRSYNAELRTWTCPPQSLRKLQTMLRNLGCEGTEQLDAEIARFEASGTLMLPIVPDLGLARVDIRNTEEFATQTETSTTEMSTQHHNKRDRNDSPPALRQPLQLPAQFQPPQLHSKRMDQHFPSRKRVNALTDEQRKDFMSGSQSTLSTASTDGESDESECWPASQMSSQ
eukprot:TRINITY_DN1023_c0_g1_i1.p1 TRINITY_DN1023_c0_g1~~TRINITY_DN1023_c0_g1_i1.p1  ORF type:complete len:385 (-),score=58.46 TRINITY_DN1023_c0_g1_i1:1266-2420(-)